jgi:hypothetical protein
LDFKNYIIHYLFCILKINIILLKLHHTACVILFSIGLNCFRNWIFCVIWTYERYRINFFMRYPVSLYCIGKSNICMVKDHNLTSENSSLCAYWICSLTVVQNRLGKRDILCWAYRWVDWLDIFKYILLDMLEWLCIWIILIWTETILLNGISIWHNKCGLKSPRTTHVCTRLNKLC